MPATADLRALGQSIWLDNITRPMLDGGAIRDYVERCSVSGLTSNPSIFDKALGTGAYDEAIAEKAASGLGAEDVFFELAVEDLRRAAALFADEHRRTGGADGWVSLEVSPELAYDTAGTVAAATALWSTAGLANLFIKIPGTPEGLVAVEEVVAAGVPVNVTLLFGTAQYEAAAEAYLRGVERRVADGLDPAVGSVASVFMSRWDTAVADRVPEELRHRLGVAVGAHSYRAYRELLDSERWRRLDTAGARPQRLLFASTSTKDPAAPDTLYVDGLAAPDTINTMPEATLEAFFDHGATPTPLDPGGGDCDDVLAAFAAVGVDVDGLAATLQRDGAAAFVSSWQALVGHVDAHGRSVA